MRAVSEKLSDMDASVLMLANAGYLDTEIREAIDCSEGALVAALDRLANWLAPTAASRQSIDLWDCLPFHEEIFAPPGSPRSRRDLSRSGEAAWFHRAGGGDILHEGDQRECGAA